MVVIEDITDAEAAREAAERAEQERAALAAAEQERAAQAAEEEQRRAAAAQADAGRSNAEHTGGAAGGEGAAVGEAGGSQAAADAPSQQPAELGEADKEQLAAAEKLKQQGNEHYAKEQWQEALEVYAAALDAAPEAAAAQRAVYHGNRAAALLKLEDWAAAAQECSAALELDPAYCKVLLRRSTAYEKLDDLERALADMQKVLELDPSNVLAAQAVKRLTPVVEERREKLKEEMFGKLKDLGNMVLGKFGLSVDNFKAEQDPGTGSYSIKFQQ